MTESPARSSLTASIGTLPLQSPHEPLYNCTSEFIIEPLPSLQSSLGTANSGQLDGRPKKSAKNAGSKSPSPASSPRPSSPVPESPELEQSREWCASASQNAKTQPDLAYKMFARAGQTFAKHYRTREAAQCYFSVVQLQNSILKAKASESSQPYLNTLPTFLEIAIADPGIGESSQQTLSSLSVLFKSYLYLARLFRPHDPAISLKMFWNCLETVIPSQLWANMEKILWNESFASSHAASTIPLIDKTRSARDQLTHYCEQMAVKLQPGLAFVDAQRSKAGQVLSLTVEVAIIATELAGFLCAREASGSGICLYEVSLALSSLDDGPESSSAKKAVSGNNTLPRQATIFGALRLPHWQCDCLIESLCAAEGEELSQTWYKAMVIAINLDDQVRVEKLLTVQQTQSSPLTRLLEVLAKSNNSGDIFSLERLEMETWALDVMAKDSTLCELLELVKSRQ